MVRQPFHLLPADRLSKLTVSIYKKFYKAKKLSGLRIILISMLISALWSGINFTDTHVIAQQASTFTLQQGSTSGSQIFIPSLSYSSVSWPMLAANPQRTSWVAEEVRGNLKVEWYLPIEPYIPYKVQPIAAYGNIYISTSRGLYAFQARDGSLLWVYPTELPLGHSPTLTYINGRNVAFVGGYDRKIHAVDAITGKNVPGYTPYEAGAGFETNPLVINKVIYAGSRDGYFYALDAVTGALKWKYQTGGPILFSAAFKNGVVYFASNDSHAYALKINGSLVWKSQKLPGAGFHSFWPVIYTDKLTGKDYVIFSGGENYRMNDRMNLVSDEAEYFYPGCHNIGPNPCPPGGALIGPSSTAPAGDTFWTPGTSLIDMRAITNYYENYAYRRTVFVLDSSNGQEYSFDSDSDGKPEYAPFTWSGVTTSGNKYPPLVNSIDKIVYDHTIYMSSGGWIPRGDVVGWKPGTRTVSRVEGGPSAHAVDEPMAFSSGGKMIYWSLCCDREAGGFDVTLPPGQGNRSWLYFVYNLLRQAPDYDLMYFDGDVNLYHNEAGWQTYSGRYQSKNTVYGKHGTTQSPPIPYQGKLYMIKGNALMAFSANGGATKLPLAQVVAPPQSSTTSITKTDLDQRLEAEVQNMVNSGHLRPGYFSGGFIDQYSANYADNKDFGEVFDYFQNPADTVVTLLQALPYLSPSLQSQVKTYLQNNYGPLGTYPFTSIVHVGWKDGAAREIFDIPQDIWANKFASFGPRTSPLCGNCKYWQSFPPYSFYAAWRYAMEFGNAKPIFDSMSSKLEAPLSDAYFIEKPYFLNLYIAGYQGYLELQKLAGYGETPAVRNSYNHMLGLRTNNFANVFKNPPSTNYYPIYENYYHTLSVARNFMFLTPELADYMNQHIPAQELQNVLSEYNYTAPYWFVVKFDNSIGEGTFQQLYDSPAMFQAKAYILKQPYSEMVKWLDVPAFYRGDLFYIQNLVAALNAAP